MMSLTNKLLWIVYLALLAVLLPHTAWAFGRFEPGGSLWVAYSAAFAFEAAIAALTHKLAQHIATVGRGKARFRRRYLNAYAAGLVVAVGVSTLANLAHAVEFGQPLAIYGSGSALPALYSLAFGAILPAVSLLFARVLSGATDDGEADPEFEAEKEKNRDLRREKRELRTMLETANVRVAEAEETFGAAAALFGEDTQARIAAAMDIWPGEPQAFWAKAARCAPSTVSAAVRGNGHN